ncbi:MAG TPA: hypothetical protein VG816_03995 [Solirubrobacterales bacterium]|nr:hypothetical protein [Solirubrobacterales bacterium]
MADQNPTGRGAAVALNLPVDQIRFLRSTFKSARAGIYDELREYPGQLGEPSRLRREVVVYGRLLTALDELVVFPDPDLRDVVSDLAKIIDDSNEYGRVVAEHGALHGLLDQLGGNGVVL